MKVWLKWGRLKCKIGQLLFYAGDSSRHGLCFYVMEMNWHAWSQWKLKLCERNISPLRKLMLSWHSSHLQLWKIEPSGQLEKIVVVVLQQQLISFPIINENRMQNVNEMHENITIARIITEQSDNILRKVFFLDFIFKHNIILLSSWNNKLLF